MKICVIRGCNSSMLFSCLSLPNDYTHFLPIVNRIILIFIISENLCNQWLKFFIFFLNKYFWTRIILVCIQVMHGERSTARNRTAVQVIRLRTFVLRRDRQERQQPRGGGLRPSKKNIYREEREVREESIRRFRRDSQKLWQAAYLINICF